MRNFTYQDDADDYADAIFHRYVEDHGHLPPIPRPPGDKLRAFSFRMVEPLDKTTPHYERWVQKVYEYATQEAEDFQAFIDDVFRTERD